MDCGILPDSSMRSVAFFVLFAGASAAAVGQKYLDALHGVREGVIPASMMQQIQKALSASGSTPEVVSSLSGLLKKLADTAVSIKTARNGTQNTINDLVEDVEMNNTLQADAKSQAVVDDQAWVQCVQDLKTDRQTFDKATSTRVDQQAKEKQTCQLAQDASIVEAEIPSVSMSCNFEDGNCASAFEKLNQTEIDTMSMSIEAVEVAVQDYDEKLQSCNLETVNRQSREKEESDAKAAWEDKIVACNKRQQTATDAMCKFSKAYNLKCQSIANYDSLVSSSKDKNTDASSLDRQEEWKTTKVTECLLTALLNKGTIDADSCLANVDYTKQVGLLSYAAKTVDDLRVNCDETGKIPFKYSGSSWTVASQVKSSADYTKVSGVTITSDSLQCK